MQQTIKELTPATITWNAENRATTANQEVKFDLSGHVIIHEADRFELKLTIASNLENNQRLDYKNGLVVPVRDWLRPELEAVGISFDPEDACGHQNNYVFTRLVTAMRNEKTKFPAEFKFNMWKTPEQKTTATEEESPEMRFTLTQTGEPVAVTTSYPILGEQSVTVKRSYKFALQPSTSTEGEPIGRIIDVLVDTTRNFCSSISDDHSAIVLTEENLPKLSEFCETLIEEIENRPEFNISLELDNQVGDLYDVMASVDGQDGVSVMQVKFANKVAPKEQTDVAPAVAAEQKKTRLMRTPRIAPTDATGATPMYDSITRVSQSFGQATERFREKQSTMYYVNFTSEPGMFRFFDNRTGRVPSTARFVTANEIGDMIRDLVPTFMNSIGNTDRVVISQDAVAFASASMVAAAQSKNGVVECYYEVLGNGLVLNVGDDYVILGKITSPTKTTPNPEIDIKISKGVIAKIEVSLNGFGLTVASVGSGTMLEFIIDPAAGFNLSGEDFDEIMHSLTGSINIESQFGESLIMGLRQLSDMVTRRKYATRWFVTAKGEVIIDN